MPLLESKVDRKSAGIRGQRGRDARRWSTNCAPARRKTALGGGEAARAKHVARGKLLPRDRVEMLLDPGRAVPGAVAAGGLRHVRRRIARRRHHHRHRPHRGPRVRGGVQRPDGEGRHVLPGHASRSTCARSAIAEENRLPCIYLVDSGGAHLPSQDEVFPDQEHFGRIFFNQANMSAAGIPQIAVVMGSCTAGGAYVPAMSDESIIVRNQGTIFLGGPPLVKAATGEVVSAEELGGGEVHAQHLRRGRSPGGERFACARHRAPHRRRLSAGPDSAAPGTLVRARRRCTPAEDLYGIIPTDTRKPYDAREIIARLVDGSDFDEWKARFGTTLVTGFARIHGMPVGILANNGILFSESAQKGAHFIELCLPAARAAGVPAEHHRLHGRQEIRERGHRASRRQDGDRGGLRARAEVHGDRRRQLRRGQLRHVRARLLAAFPVDLAELAHLRDGRRTGGERAGHRAARRHRSQGRQLERARKRPRSRRRSASSTRRRAIPTTPPRASGTTASSTRPTRAVPGARPGAAALQQPIPETTLRRVPDVRRCTELPAPRRSSSAAPCAGCGSTGPTCATPSTMTLIAEICRGIRRHRGIDAETRVVVVAARGPAFCAGADLNWMRAMAGFSHADNHADALQGGAHVPRRAFLLAAGDRARAGRCLRRWRRPRGSLRHRGRVDKVQFGLSEVRLGIVAATISPHLVRAMGAAPGRALHAHRREIPAQQAQRDRPGARSRDSREELDCEVERLVATRCCRRARRRWPPPSDLLADVVEAPMDDVLLAATRQVHRRRARVTRRARRHRGLSREARACLGAELKEK